MCPTPRARRELRVVVVSILAGMAIGATIMAIHAGQAAETDAVSGHAKLKSSAPEPLAAVPAASPRIMGAEDFSFGHAPNSVGLRGLAGVNSHDCGADRPFGQAGGDRRCFGPCEAEILGSRAVGGRAGSEPHHGRRGGSCGSDQAVSDTDGASAFEQGSVTPCRDSVRPDRATGATSLRRSGLARERRGSGLTRAERSPLEGVFLLRTSGLRRLRGWACRTQLPNPRERYPFEVPR